MEISLLPASDSQLNQDNTQSTSWQAKASKPKIQKLFKVPRWHIHSRSLCSWPAVTTVSHLLGFNPQRPEITVMPEPWLYTFHFYKNSHFLLTYVKANFIPCLACKSVPIYKPFPNHPVKINMRKIYQFSFIQVWRTQANNFSYHRQNFTGGNGWKESFLLSGASD